MDKVDLVQVWTGGGLFEYGTEAPGSVKCGAFLI